MKSQGGGFNRAPRQLSGRNKDWEVSESLLVPTSVKHPMAISGKSGLTSTRNRGGHCPSLFSTQVLLRISSHRGQFPTRRPSFVLSPSLKRRICPYPKNSPIVPRPACWAPHPILGRQTDRANQDNLQHPPDRM